VFTARYAMSPYIEQIRFVFKGLMMLLGFICHSVVLSALYILILDLAKPQNEAQDAVYISTTKRVLVYVSNIDSLSLYVIMHKPDLLFCSLRQFHSDSIGAIRIDDLYGLSFCCNVDAYSSQGLTQWRQHYGLCANDFATKPDPFSFLVTDW
jgi:hypothetical protein